MNNPIHQYNGKWWFWDELFLYRFGPYDNRDDAAKMWFTYCKYLDKQGWDMKQTAKQIDWDFIAVVILLGAIFLALILVSV